MDSADKKRRRKEKTKFCWWKRKNRCCLAFVALAWWSDCLRHRFFIRWLGVFRIDTTYDDQNTSPIVSWTCNCYVFRSLLRRNVSRFAFLMQYFYGNAHIVASRIFFFVMNNGRIPRDHWWRRLFQRRDVLQWSPIALMMLKAISES